MLTQVNPYQSPAASAAMVAEDDRVEHVYFHGSITLEEGDQIDRLTSGKKRGPRLTILACLSVGVPIVLAVGVLGYDLILSGELGEFMEMVLALLVIGVLIAAGWWQDKSRKRLLEELKAAEQGVFTRVSGRLSGSGIEFLAEDFPVHYQWDDFVGNRVDDDVALLYVEYPHERNFLAASWFSSQRQWEAAKAIVARHVPRIPRLSWRRRKAPSRRMTHIVAGIHQLNAHAWKEAVAEFDQALAIDPTNSQSLRGRAVALAGLRELDAAMIAIEKAVEYGGADSMTRRLRSNLLLVTEQYQRALADLNWLLEKNPRDPELLRDRGLAYLKLGQCDAALRDASAAIDGDPQDAVAFSNRGATLIELGRAEEAIDDLERAIQLDGEFERPHEHLVRAKAMLAQHQTVSLESS